MEKITAKLLLERASPKASMLEEIKNLNLSGLGLKCEHLPIPLLCRLRALESWDLSGNRLEELPRGLALPALRSLDLSGNEMDDVTTLDSLTSLEELKMEDNMYITVNDNYKLMVLLPKLKMYNGKDITSTANHMRYVYGENLRTRIVAVWQTDFHLPSSVTEEKVAVLERDFVKAARNQVKFGPSSISDYTKWRVEMIAKEHLQSLLRPKEASKGSWQLNDPKENNNDTSPAKRRRLAPDTGDTPSLRPRRKVGADPPGDGDTATHTPARPRPTPRKVGLASAVRSSPRKAAANVKEEGEGAAIQSRDGPRSPRKKSRSRTQEAVRLKPLHVLQCHSKQDGSEDFSTQLWACAFQPPPHSSSTAESAAGSRLVATCGGDSLCVIDCETGMVMKKYKVPGEEFFSLAWSTVFMSGKGSGPVRPCSILAAGGKRGQVKLIHPRANVAYGEFHASSKALSILHFNPRQGNFLFAGSYDNKITMWDIGGVDSQYNFKAIQLLVLACKSTPLHLCLPPASPDTHLLAATDDGLRCFNTELHKNTMKRTEEMEITFPIYKEEDKDCSFRTIDGLRFLTDDVVASKSYMQASIYLWSWSQTHGQRPHNKTGRVHAVLLAELQWANTDMPYLSLSTCPGESYVVCGDDAGRLWTYHTDALLRTKSQSGKLTPPTEVLEWPAPVRKGLSPVEGPAINSVAMDPELSYLVALSDKNMVVVWKRLHSSS